MLLIEGEIDKKLYKKEVVTFDQALELFDMEHYFDFVRKGDKNARVEFEYDSSRVINKGGAQRFPSGWRVPSTMKVTLNGRIVRVTYAESERYDSESKQNITLPLKVSFGGRRKRTFFWNRDRELILWLALHPSNSSSPLRKEGDNSPVVWDLVDKEKRADAWEKLASQDLIIRNQFMSDDIAVLKRKAKGMGFVFPKDAKDSIIRKALMQGYEAAISRNQAVAFMDKFNKAQTTLAGAIQELIDKGFIIQGKKDSTGRIVWCWKNGLQRSGVILTVERGQNAEEALKSFMVSQFDTFEKTITSLLTQDKVDSNPNIQSFANELNAPSNKTDEVSVDELTGDQLAKELKYNDLVGFNPETSAVHCYSQKDYGQFLKDELVKVETPKNWLVELAIALEDNKNLEMRVSLAERLEKFRNQ